MSTPFKMTPGRGPYQKTGRGIPMSFQSPLNQQSFEEKLAAAKKAIVDKNKAKGKEQKEVRQSSVLDSLNTVVKEGEGAAAKKYGNKARKAVQDKRAKNTSELGTGALPEDASENKDLTEQYRRKSKAMK